MSETRHSPAWRSAALQCQPGELEAGKIEESAEASLALVVAIKNEELQAIAKEIPLKLKMVIK